MDAASRVAMRKGIPARDGKATLMKGCMQRIRGERERGWKDGCLLGRREEWREERGKEGRIWVQIIESQRQARGSRLMFMFILLHIPATK